MCAVLSHVWLLETPWTVAHQSPLSWSSPGNNTEWVSISYSRRSFQPGDWIHIFCISRWILYDRATWEALISEIFQSKLICPWRTSPIENQNIKNRTSEVEIDKKLSCNQKLRTFSKISGFCFFDRPNIIKSCTTSIIDKVEITDALWWKSIYL